MALIRLIIVTCLCAHHVCSLHSHKEPSDRTFFLKEILQKYGNGEYITFEGFEHLLENLGLGKLEFKKHHKVDMHKVNGTFKEIHHELDLHMHHHQENQTEEQSERTKRNVFTQHIYINGDRENTTCLTPQDILTAFDLKPHHDIITPVSFIQICPAIVYELDERTCWPSEQKNTKEEIIEIDYKMVWIFATASIVVMGSAGVLLALLLPVTKTRFYKPISKFFIALAAGTLCGDAVMHLLPHALAVNLTVENETVAIYRSMVVFLAFIFFFIIEGIIKLHRFKRQKIKLDKVDIEIEKDEKDMETVYKEKPEPVLAVEPEENHNHGHSHSFSSDTLAWVIIIGDILHNVTDGLSIGAAFVSSPTSGLSSSIAIFCHELPHELGDYVVLLKTMSIKKAIMYNIISSIFSFVGMAMGVGLGSIGETASLWINAFTAGSFLYIALADLLPEIKNDIDENPGFWNLCLHLSGLISGGILMLVIALFEDDLENAFH